MALDKKLKLDIIIGLTYLAYKGIVKPVLFQINPELVHESMVSFGQFLGTSSFTKEAIKSLYNHPSLTLSQEIAGINFLNPTGLSAGFDYNAKLTQILPSLNFGFTTVGTVTNLPYEGNPRPRLGRLPKSRSLMVNKGFRSEGALAIINRLEPLNLNIPIGISIGKTNIPEVDTQKKSIADIISTFTAFEKSKVKHKYYELNISCPNLSGKVDFYQPSHLKELLSELALLHIKKPIFVKMPINKSDKEVLGMLNIISQFNFKGVIFGNLQKDRRDPSLFSEEVIKFKVGNFSGKPTEKRSNELISLSYKHFGKKLTIIGCGGVFNASDAYTKIKLGASLVELITGLIYQGPHLVSLINRDLEVLLKKDGLKNISQAIGVLKINR